MGLTLHDRNENVDDAIRAVEAFKNELLKYVDLYWWSLPIGIDDVLALRDYAIGVLSAIPIDLEQARVAKSHYAKMRFAQATAYQENQKIHAHPLAPGDTRERIDERSTEIRVYRLAVIVSLAAAFDCLAGVTTAVLGLGMSVIKADLGTLYTRPEFGLSKLAKPCLSSDEVWRAVQTDALTRIASIIQGAGPDGWVSWLLDDRNTLVHRELPTEISIVKNTHGRTHWHQVLAQSPRYSNIQALQSGDQREDFNELILTEDSLDTLTGLLASTATAIRASVAVLAEVWGSRRSTRPAVDWEKQWPPAGDLSGFQGYNPGSVVLEKDSVMVMSPEHAKRLREAGVVKTN